MGSSLSLMRGGYSNSLKIIKVTANITMYDKIMVAVAMAGVIVVRCRWSD